MGNVRRYYCRVCQPRTGCRCTWLTAEEIRIARRLGHEVRRVGFSCAEWKEERRYLSDLTRPRISLDDVLDMVVALRLLPVANMVRRSSA